MAQTGVVLLAAGNSERFGNDKRLAVVDNGYQEPMLLATIRSLRATALPLFVVLRPGDHQWEAALDDLGIDWGTCPEAKQGIGCSLAFGVHATQHWNSWLIAMADMPFIRPQTFRLLADTLQDHAIVRPVTPGPHSHRHGQPLGFQRAFAFELMQSQGENDAAALLQRHAGQVTEVICDDEGILRDIDRPEDLQAG